MTRPVSPTPVSASDRRPHGVAGPLVLLTLIVVAALSRVLPHPPNFSPVEAIALFGGAYFLSRTAAVLVPLAGMLLSDLALAAINGGEYASWFGSTSIYVVYLCIALTSLLGMQLRGRVSSGRVPNWKAIWPSSGLSIQLAQSSRFQTPPAMTIGRLSGMPPSRITSRNSLTRG